MKFVIAVFSFAVSVSAFASQFKHIEAVGGYSQATSNAMLAQVEEDTREKLIDACGSLENVKRIRSLKITLGESDVFLRPQNAAGSDMLLFVNYPASTLSAEVECAPQAFGKHSR